MGNSWSSMEEQPPVDPWWPSAQQQPGPSQSVRSEEIAGAPSRGKIKEEELETFKQELAKKRALRHEALAALQAEMRDLRSKVEEERSLRHKAEEEIEKFKITSTEQLQRELEKEKEEKKKLLEEREHLMDEVEEKAGLERQVQALKDVSQIGKEMLRIRELQVKELKKKLVEINISSVVAPPEDLRIEYEKQIENIRKLRTLYEERAAATLLEHRRELEREEARIAVLETKLSDVNKEIDDYKEIKKELEGKIEKLEFKLQQNEDELEKTKDDLFSSSVQNNSLNSQMTLINNLFSQMLVSPEVDLDRLTRLLKEHHGLITDLTTKGDSNEVAALLVDLAEQMDKEKESDKKEEQSSNENDHINKQFQSEIASNLSKVWRVMIELLSHHQTPTHTEPAGGADSCYKSIQTPAGPRSVISVSQTFLTLKDLILEKNKLVKEVGRLKTLNNHLEHRLGNQEKRLSIVTTELKKTWAVVNKLKAQHKQLHTHEKILRYELQQKRCMLTELKGELEHCRDKWEKARQKNSQTEEDWKKLRKEFAARKSRKESNSAESGYEEDDVQSPPSEENKYERNEFELRNESANGLSEPELSEEDIEHSDGNSFDTVIDLLDIDCLENQRENQSDVSFALRDVSPQTLEIPSSLLPLTGSEFTEGLDQIESEDLAAVLDIQYQTQLLGADYNLSLPSSSGSSPVPTENDDFTSSEVDISEEDASSSDIPQVNDHIYSSPLPHANQPMSEDVLLFGSNSSKNISRFLDGLFIEAEQNSSPQTTPTPNLSLNIPSTSKIENESHLAIPSINNESYCNSLDDLTPIVSEDNFCIPSNSNDTDVGKVFTVNEQLLKNDQVQNEVPSHSHSQQLVEREESINEHALENATGPVTMTQEELLKVREDRLKRLEYQCRSLVNKVTSTSFRSELISNKLDKLHLAYGEVESEKSSESKNESGRQEIESTQNTMTVYSEASSSRNSLPLKKLMSENEGVNEKGAATEEKEEVNALPSNLKNQNETAYQNRIGESSEMLDTRATKLIKLEGQCKSLFSKISATSSRQESIFNKFDELHGSYGSSDQTTTASGQEPDSNISTPVCENLTPNKTMNKSNSFNQELSAESKLPDLASESKEILNQCSLPGPSLEITKSETDCPKQVRTQEEILEARAERFRRLEDQCKSLLSKMTATSLRSEIISNKLDELHSCYGSSEDASDNEEHSLSSKTANKNKRLVSPSSSRYNKKLTSPTESGNNTLSTNAQITSAISSENCKIEGTALQEGNVVTENCTDNHIDGNSVLLSRISEDIVQAHEQRLEKPEEQCECLLSKLPLPLNDAAVINDHHQDLHKQNSQSSTSKPTLLRNSVCRVEKNEGDGSKSFSNTSKLNTDTTEADLSNNTTE